MKVYINSQAAGPNPNLSIIDLEYSCKNIDTHGTRGKYAQTSTESRKTLFS